MVVKEEVVVAAPAEAPAAEAQVVDLDLHREDRHRAHRAVALLDPAPVLALAPALAPAQAPAQAPAEEQAHRHPPPVVEPKPDLVLRLHTVVDVTTAAVQLLHTRQAVARPRESCRWPWVSLL